MLARALAENLDTASDTGIELRARGAIDDFEEILVAEFFHFFGDLLLHFRGRRIAARRVSKHEGIVEADSVSEIAGLIVVLVRLSREADNDIGRDGNAWARLTQPLNEARIRCRRVTAPHHLENPVGATLQGKMNVLNKLVLPGEDADEVLTETDGVRGGEAHASDPVNRADSIDELNKRTQAIAFLKLVAPVEIDDLTEEGDLLYAPRRQVFEPPP